MLENISFGSHYFMNFLNGYIFFWTIALSALMVRLMLKVRKLKKLVFNERGFAIRYRFSFHLALALHLSAVLTIIGYTIFPVKWAEMIALPIISNLLIFYILYCLIESSIFDVNEEEAVYFTGVFDAFHPIEKSKNKKLSTLALEIEACFKNEKPYLQDDFSLSILANLLKAPGHQISAVLKNELDTSFPNLVKRYRVQELQNQLLSTDSKHLSIEGIGKQCGFRSKSVMHTQFKEITGKTPSQYIKTQK
jgi:AraC-like DNA-binding protein